MNTAKIRMLFKQFNMGNALRFLIAKVMQKTFDPHNFPSYSQFGEDRIISVFFPTGEGFYVDVGCNQPQYYSNTFSLYKSGWKGITIDGNSDLIREQRKQRKRDSSICAVVSNEKKDLLFTEFEASEVSTVNSAHVDEWKGKSEIIKERIVTPVSLETILNECKAPKRFDLLSIDVEGHEFEVLSSVNFHIYRPKLIIIEIHGFDLLNPLLSKAYEYLVSNNYKMVGYVIVNGYFIDNMS